MRIHGLVAKLLSGAAVLLASSSAKAQYVSLSRFDPAERGSRFFVADSLDFRYSVNGVNRPMLTVGMPMSYAFQTRTFGSSRTEGQKSDLSEHALYMHPGASIVVSPGARFAFDLPIAAGQDGEDTNLNGNYYPSPRSPRLGDLRIAFDVRIFGPASEERQVDGVSLAMGVRGWLPTGSAEDYTGDDATRFGVHVASTARFGVLLASARAGYMYRRDGFFGARPIGSELNGVLAIGYSDTLWTIGPELYGASLIDRFLKTKSTPVEILAGAHRAVSTFRFGAGIGTSVVSGLGAPHLRALVSAEWAPIASASANVSADRDRDGVPDIEDACPDVPASPQQQSQGGDGSSPFTSSSSRGCPSAPGDVDHDGIIDSDDACPTEPGIRTRDRKTTGCPDRDRDGDGILDSVDACPDVPGAHTSDAETNGCPAHLETPDPSSGSAPSNPPDSSMSVPTVP